MIKKTLVIKECGKLILKQNNCLLFIKIIFIFCLFVLNTNILSAQAKLNFNEIKNKFPNEDLLYLKVEEKVVIKIKSGKLDITSQNFSSNLFLTDRANEFASSKIYYSEAFQEIANIAARTIVPDKKSYKTLTAEEKNSANAMSSGSFYDDYKVKTIMFPGLQAGAQTELSYEEKIKDPHFLSSFHFKKGAPVQQISFSVEFPEEVKINYIFIGDSSNIRFTRKTKGKITSYTWEARNMAKLPYEADAPDVRYYSPHVILYVDEFTINGQKQTVFGNVDRLYSWYYDLTKDVNKKNEEQVKRLVDSLVHGTKTDHEKLKKIYYWVQDHIKYIAFEDGMGGFIPRDAADVCFKRYGDCKDMANLLYAMLSEAKIPVSRTWIGTRDIPYTYKDVPTPAVDNHMIAVAKLDGKNYFLDATGGFLSLNYPTPMIQGKEALLSLGKDKYEVIKVPVVPAAQNLIFDSCRLKIEGTELIGNFSTFITGLEKFNITNKYSNYGKVKRAEELKKSIRIGNNKSIVNTLQLKGFDDRDSALSLNYEMNIPDYILKRDKEIYVNMCLNKHLQSAQIDTSLKKLDKENENLYIYKSYSSLEIPAGYKAKLPVSKKWKNELFSFNISYAQKGNLVECKQEININYLLLSPDKFIAWNEMIDELKDAYKQLVVLKQ